MPLGESITQSLSWTLAFYVLAQILDQDGIPDAPARRRDPEGAGRLFAIALVAIGITMILLIL